MIFFLNALAGILSGIVGSLGLGGGGVLVLYLVLYLNMNQIEAQGINLLFFIPTATISVIIHNKNKLIKWKKAIPLIITGMIGVFVGMMFIEKIEPTVLKKIFAILIFIIGVKELISTFWKEKKDDKKPSFFHKLFK